MSDKDLDSRTEGSDKDFSDVEDFLKDENDLFEEDGDSALNSEKDTDDYQDEHDENGGFLSDPSDENTESETNEELPEKTGDDDDEEEYEQDSSSSPDASKKNKIIIFGVMGVVAISAAGFVALGGGSKAIEPPQLSLEPIYQAPEKVTEDSAIEVTTDSIDKISEEDPFLSDGDFDFESYNSESDSEPNVIEASSSPGAELGLVKEAQEVKNTVNKEPSKALSEDSAPLASDRRIQMMMDEYIKESDFVGSDDLEEQVALVRKHLDDKLEESEKIQAELKESIESEALANREQDVAIQDVQVGLDEVRIQVAQLFESIEEPEIKSVIEDPYEKVASDRNVILEPKMINSSKEKEVIIPKEAAVVAAFEPVDPQRSRLPGFKILTTSDDGRMAIAKTPSGKVQVFFEGELLRVRGEGSFRVTGMQNGGTRVLVGNYFYFDETYVDIAPEKKTSPKKSSPKVKKQKDGVETTVKVTEPDYIIAEKNPRAEHQAMVQNFQDNRAPTQSDNRIESSSNQAEWAEGWSVVGGEVGQSRYLVRSPEGRWHAVRPGQKISGLGEVSKMDPNGNLKVGEYRIKGK
jgi:hypothetical protein